MNFGKLARIPSRAIEIVDNTFRVFEWFDFSYLRGKIIIVFAITPFTTWTNKSGVIIRIAFICTMYT